MRGLDEFSAGSTICAWTFGTPHQRRKWRISRVQGPENIDAKSRPPLHFDVRGALVVFALRRFATSITSRGSASQCMLTWWTTLLFHNFSADGTISSGVEGLHLHPNHRPACRTWLGINHGLHP